MRPSSLPLRSFVSKRLPKFKNECPTITERLVSSARRMMKLRLLRELKSRSRASSPLLKNAVPSS